MYKICTVIAVVITSLLVGCEEAPPPPPKPSAVALDNLYDSWNHGTFTLASQFKLVSCENTLEKHSVLGEVVQCSAMMRGYVNYTYFLCSTKPKGGCRTL